MDTSIQVTYTDPDPDPDPDPETDTGIQVYRYPDIQVYRKRYRGIQIQVWRGTFVTCYRNESLAELDDGVVAEVITFVLIRGDQKLMSSSSSSSSLSS